MSIIRYDSFHTLLENYTRELPLILGQHSRTAELVPRAKQGLEQKETPFTVAVVGQMRVGKSSLLNTLVGADLAVVGVDVTTATINWFKFPDDEHCVQHFRVVWKDGKTEMFPRSEIGKWVGNSELALQTRRLEFFADVPFLKNAYIVDTPGTRSVYDDHETKIQNFIADKLETETQREGDRADAIIYVFPAVARATDKDLLQSFGQGSRIQNAAPYNSVAVVHKWETIESSDPFAEVQQKVVRIKKDFASNVAEVLPVSAPMGWACEHFDGKFWKTVFELGTQSADVRNELFIYNDDDFVTNIPGCTVSIEDRKGLLANYKLPWPTLKFIINRVVLESIPSPEKLKSRIHEVSGIQQLRDMLEKRFFSRAKMIRSFGVLAKTLPACDEASQSLRNHKKTFSTLLDDVGRSLKGSAIPAAIRDYIQETRDLVNITGAADTLRALDELVQPVKDAFEEMNNDVKYLDQLDLLDRFDWSATWKPKLANLFGQSGPELENRVAPFIPNPSKDDVDVLVECLENAITELVRLQSGTTGTAKTLLEHARDRLGQILDQLDGDGS